MHGRLFTWSAIIVLTFSLQGCAGSTPEAATLPLVTGLPDPLLFKDGTRIVSAAAWERRRTEIIETLMYYEYGRMPDPPTAIPSLEFSEETVLEDAVSFLRTTVRLGPDGQIPMRFAVYLPKGADGPVPVVLAVEPVWEAHLLPIAKLVTSRGYAFAGYEARDLAADVPERNGIQLLYPEHDWATLAVWAWGAMRAVDCLEQVSAVDPTRIAITGHSRGGKAALLAGALDKRIALTAPHASGAGGAALYRILGPDSESLALITDPQRFHYWFSSRLTAFAGKESSLPFDQHFLLAAVAPRALLCMEATEDFWSNPLGTQRAHQAAQPVFDLLRVPERNAIAWRSGGHDMTHEDWGVLLDFADHVFLGHPAARNFNEDPFAQPSGGETP
jgi:dienelactone hydrolase